MTWRRESSLRVEAGLEHPARFSGTSFEESPFSSKTSCHPSLPGARLVICGFRRDPCRLRAPHLKRSTLNDPENDGREPISVFLGVVHDLANGGSIVILHASSQRERH